MTTVFEIPLQPQSQKFSITLSGQTYNFQVIWREAAEGGWVLDIANVNNVSLACGLAMVPKINLLQQYAYLGIGGSLIVETTEEDGVPKFDTMGSATKLYYVTEP